MYQLVNGALEAHFVADLPLNSGEDLVETGETVTCLCIERWESEYSPGQMWSSGLVLRDSRRERASYVRIGRLVVKAGWFHNATTEVAKII